MKTRRKDKNLKIKGEGLTIKAIAIGLPTKDIAVSIFENKMITQSQVADESKKTSETIKEWFESSSLLDPKHFIIEINTPSYRDLVEKERNMVFVTNLNVYSRKVIRMGQGEASFTAVFADELQRLFDLFKQGILVEGCSLEKGQ